MKTKVEIKESILEKFFYLNEALLSKNNRKIDKLKDELFHLIEKYKHADE